MEISRVGNDLVVEVHNQERAIIKIRSESLERDGEISGAVILYREDVGALRDALERAEHVAARMERQAGIVCALCGGPIRTTADVQYCPTCGTEHGPMIPAVRRYGVETPTARWFDGQEKSGRPQRRRGDTLASTRQAGARLQRHETSHCVILEDQN